MDRYCIDTSGIIAKPVAPTETRWIDLRSKFIDVGWDGDVYLAQGKTPICESCIGLSSDEPDGFCCIPGNEGGHILDEPSVIIFRAAT
jgi:hypothetical protein